MTGPSDDTIRSLLASGERLIGYVYAGFLPFAIAAIENPSSVETIVNAIGGLLTAIILIAVGIGVYAIYFRLIGELVLFPIQHLVHLGFDFVAGRKGLKRTSTIGLMLHLGVPLLQARGAYEAVKNEFFQDREATEIQISPRRIACSIHNGDSLLWLFRIAIN